MPEENRLCFRQNLLEITQILLMAINDKIFEIGEVSDKVKIDKGA